ncbi:MAG: LPS assembly protein LptD [Phycisphaerae bacterium]
MSEFDAEMHGKFAWQWQTPENELAVLFQGDFQFTLGRRRLSSDDAVVWIKTEKSATGKTFHILTVYLSGHAEVAESVGTVTVDHVLLVSNLRTSGEVFKSQDSHTRQSAAATEFYERAKAARDRIEAGKTIDPQYSSVRRPDGKLPPDPQRAQREVEYQTGSIETGKDREGKDVYVATGGVYFAQGGGGVNRDIVEIRAKNAVIFPAQGLADSFGGAAADQEPDAASSGQNLTTQPGSPPPVAQPLVPGVPATSASSLGTANVAKRVRSVYLEGDVVLSYGSRFIRASRLYYDFELERAIILDSVFRADLPDRGIPFYVRADEIRQLSATEFEATNARVTTSEFYTPHYHVGVDKLYLRDMGTQERQEIAGSGIAGRYELENASLNVNNQPILFWPRAEGNLDTSETLIRRARVAYDGDFGSTIQTSWYLFNLLGMQTPPGWDASLHLDYFSDRGPAIGADFDYETPDYYGLIRSYLMTDDGFDTQLGPIRRNEWEPSSETRGRLLVRHRQKLENKWELTLEGSYVSDPNFLEIYRRSEWFEGKEQETLLYLKRAEDTEAVTFLTNWRLLDFITQTEHLPELEYRRIGDVFEGLPFVSYLESRIGAVRYRPDDRFYFDQRRIFGTGQPFDNKAPTDTTFRIDGREEVEWPFKFANMNLVPFASLRGTYWDGQPLRDNGLWRGLGVFGVRGATTLAKVYDSVRSELLDINRIRHIIEPNFVVWGAGSNTRSEFITPYDEGIETVDDFYGAKVGVKQTWQTKRGPEDAQRTVDLLSLNLEVGVFGDAQPGEISNGYVNTFRPEDSRTRNYFAGDVVYRLSDSTALLYDFNFDLNDQTYDRHSVAITVERSPRLAYVFGTRYASDISMSLVGGGFNYKLNEKHITAFRFWHDIDEGDIGEVSVAYIRKMPRWYGGLVVEYDGVDDDFRVTLTLWPEGIPEWTLGSRRFTGVASTTGIRP